jgi:hypothetical protein
MIESRHRESRVMETAGYFFNPLHIVAIGPVVAAGGGATLGVYVTASDAPFTLRYEHTSEAERAREQLTNSITRARH